MRLPNLRKKPACRTATSLFALTTNASCLTAISDDNRGYDFVYSRQIEALASPGDVAIGLSSSGDSLSVLRAFQTAKERGMCTIGLTGRGGGRLRALAEVCLCVPSADMPRIQEAHVLVGHILSEIIERELFSR